MMDQISRVRSFNRAVTRRVGALDQSYLARGRPLGEARLLFEAARAPGLDIGRLRARLSLDSGYASRLLKALERQGLVELRRGAADARVREVHVTAAGLAEVAAYDRLSDEVAMSMLAALPPAQQDRLVEAMATVERLLRAGAVTIAQEPAGSSDARHCLDAYYGELAGRFDAGFDPSGGGAFDVADMAPPAGYLYIARLDGEAVGCGALKRMDAATGEIKRVWTAPDARGLGIAARLMQALEEQARALGMRRLLLDTNRTLVEARAMYLGRGYVEIARYNDNPYADHWFEKPL